MGSPRRTRDGGHSRCSEAPGQQGSGRGPAPLGSQQELAADRKQPTGAGAARLRAGALAGGGRQGGRRICRLHAVRRVRRSRSRSGGGKGKGRCSCCSAAAGSKGHCGRCIAAAAAGARAPAQCQCNHGLTECTVSSVAELFRAKGPADHHPKRCQPCKQICSRQQLQRRPVSGKGFFGEC